MVRRDFQKLKLRYKQFRSNCTHKALNNYRRCLLQIGALRDRREWKIIVRRHPNRGTPMRKKYRALKEMQESSWSNILKSDNVILFY